MHINVSLFVHASCTDVDTRWSQENTMRTDFLFDLLELFTLPKRATSNTAYRVLYNKIMQQQELKTVKP